MNRNGADATTLANKVAAGMEARGLRVTITDGSAPVEARVAVLITRQVGEALEEIRRFPDNVPKLVLVLLDGPFDPTEAHLGLTFSGACDVLVADSCDIVGEVHRRIERWQEVQSVVDSPVVSERIIGSGTTWRSLVASVVEVACFTRDSILLTGESGTGKELFARLIHDLDRRSGKGGYVILDCTTIVPELSGSEFFGHERGAFTGAHASRDGAFALADGGTLFLDEVADLPLPLQAQLLRVIQEGTYRRVGSNAWRRTEFRLVCATNRDLDGEIAAGRFRRDLYYRIAQWIFRLPALSERREDIVPLAGFFLNNGRTAHHALRFDPLVEQFLRCRDYPGNIRELRLLVSRLRLRHEDSGVITLGCIPTDELGRRSGVEQGQCSRSSSPSCRQASSTTLEGATSAARIGAIRSAMSEIVASLGAEAAKRPLVLRRTAERLGCSLRWIQICDKDYHIFQDIVSLPR